MKKPKVVHQLFQLNRVHQLILFIVPFVLYLQTCSFDFSYHDDDSIVLYNAKSLQEFNLKKIFFSDAWMLDKKIELYRPFQTLTYAVDYFFSATKASAYHLHNVFIFCICISLFYLLLLSLQLSERVSFSLALIFSVHFLFAHTVCWIPARGDLYLFAFSMGSLLLFYLFLNKNKPVYILLSSLFYFGALLSKESAVVLLPLVYLVAVLFWKMDFRKLKSYLLPAIGIPITLLYLWMRSKSIAPSQSIYSLNGFIYNLPTIPEEVCKFFIPLFFSVMPSYSVTVTVIGLLLMGLLLTLAIVFRKKMNGALLLTGLCFFLLPLLPTLFYKPDFTKLAYDYLDHRMFFPGIGLLLIGYSVFAVTVEKYLSVTVFYGVTAVMSIIAFINSTAYKNYETYFENATTTNLKSALAHSDFGASLARENKYDKALLHFNKAVELAPENIEMRMKLADSYLYIKDYPKMISQCNAAIKIDPSFPKSYFNIALYFSDRNLNDSAMKYMYNCVKHAPKNGEAYLYKGVIEKKEGIPDSALVSFGKSISLNPELANAYFQRGDIYGNKGMFKEALSDFDHYVKLNPNDGKGYYYRGQAHCMTGSKDSGCEDLHTALQMGVTEAQAKINYWCK